MFHVLFSVQLRGKVAARETELKTKDTVVFCAIMPICKCCIWDMFSIQNECVPDTSTNPRMTACTRPETEVWQCLQHMKMAQSISILFF